jgi:RND family efflux transporter MFP subunit
MKRNASRGASGGATSAGAALLLAAGAALSGCAASSSAAEPDAGRAEVRVAVQEVGRRAIEQELRLTGDLMGEVEVRVFSTIPDRIVTLRAEEGQAVREGDVLAIIRADALSQGVQQALGGVGAATAQVDGLRDTLARQRRLLASGVVTQAQVDATEIQLRAAENQLSQLDATAASARTRRSDATVRAPISAIVGQVFVEEGDLAAPGIPICTLVQMDRVEVQVQVSERDLGLVRPGLEAEVRVATLPGRVFRAPISRISPVVDRLSRTAAVRVMLDNPDHLLMPGSLAEVRVVVDRHEDAVVVPQYALVLDDESGPGGAAQFSVYVLEGERARERRVQVGFYERDEVEVVEGLEAGERLVVQGQHLLRDGSRVTVAGDGERQGGESRGESQAARPTAPAEPAHAGRE